jgi:hypothetical protein
MCVVLDIVLHGGVFVRLAELPGLWELTGSGSSIAINAAGLSTAHS